MTARGKKKGKDLRGGGEKGVVGSAGFCKTTNRVGEKKKPFGPASQGGRISAMGKKSASGPHELGEAPSGEERGNSARKKKKSALFMEGRKNRQRQLGGIGTLLSKKK